MSEKSRGLGVVVVVVVGVAALALFFTFGLAFAADPVYSGTAVTTTTADIKDGAGATIGAAQLSQDAKGVVQVTVSGNGLTAGEHGIHIHATGKCEGPGFTSANAHFNVANHQHGLANPAGPHEGDLPGLTAAANGTYSYTATLDRISLTGGTTNLFDADGSALVIHAAKDDQVTDPTGNSGGRVACAVLAPGSAPLPPATGTGLSAGSKGNATVALAMAIVVGACALGGYRVVRIRRGL